MLSASGGDINLSSVLSHKKTCKSDASSNEERMYFNGFPRKNKANCIQKFQKKSLKKEIVYKFVLKWVKEPHITDFYSALWTFRKTILMIFLLEYL